MCMSWRLDYAGLIYGHSDSKIYSISLDINVGEEEVIAAHT